MNIPLKSFKIQAMLALLFSLIIIVAQAEDYAFDKYSGDTQGYIQVAYDVAEKGVFTDGHYGAQSPAQGPNGEGMFFSPIYPLMLAGILKIDPVFNQMVSCYVESDGTKARESCPQNIGLLKYVQMALAMISIVLIWLSGWILTNKFSIAWISTFLACAAEAYAYYTPYIITESLVFPLFTGVCLLATLAWKKKKSSLWGFCGIVLGLLALTRPSYTYLFYAAIPIITLLSLLQKEKSIKQQMLWPLLFILCYCATIGPWVARNNALFDEPSISKGYGSFILAQRVAYNDMNWNEWRASFIYSLPDFGDSIVKDIFAPEDYERLSYGNPEGFYLTSNQVLWDDVKAGKTVPQDKLSQIIKTDVLENLFKHSMVTISLAWKGMWISKYWGLIAIPLFLGVCIYAIRSRWGIFLMYSAPAWFMLFFHAFVSVNVTRYNLILIPCLSIAVAFILMSITNKTKNRLVQKK